MVLRGLRPIQADARRSEMGAWQASGDLVFAHPRPCDRRGRGPSHSLAIAPRAPAVSSATGRMFPARRAMASGVIGAESGSGGDRRHGYLRARRFVPGLRPSPILTASARRCSA
jgi:hypothetical protein